IIPLYMPPYLSYLLQPLDVSCFATLKYIYYITKLDFITAYLTAYIEALTASNIYSGFAAIGLVLFDPS
ncbi:uncharacterized protein K441DRAFT_539457, partial [Cenococcum geophilum 1.58]|uniref:uncharacterized protein n=1 Tax=Cenococcum geophilum 1.58 TaxID=794803 RepID=UPI00358E1AD5